LGDDSTVLEQFPPSLVAEVSQYEPSTIRDTSRTPLPDAMRTGRSKSAVGGMEAQERGGEPNENKGVGGSTKREKKSTGILGFLSGKKTRYGSPGHGKERGVLGKEGARVIIGGDGGASAG